MTTVCVVWCPSCKHGVFSRALHDMRYCSCGEIAVDGGFNYLRMAFGDVLPKTSRHRIAATKQQLFNDWNTRADQFGIIEPPKAHQAKEKKA